MNVIAYVVTPEGERVGYTPDPRLIPAGALGVPTRAFDSIVPGCNGLSFGRGMECTQVEKGLYRYTGTLRLDRYEVGSDGVSRRNPLASVECARVVEVDHRSEG